MAPKREGARKASLPSTPEFISVKDMAIHQKVASDIIDPMIKVDFRISLKKARHLIGVKDPVLGLDLLQIAVIADNVSAGTSPLQPSSMANSFEQWPLP